jgi:hypothetical protein
MDDYYAARGWPNDRHPCPKLAEKVIPSTGKLQADGQDEAQEAQAVRTAASLLGVPIDVVDALEGVVEMEGPSARPAIGSCGRRTTDGRYRQYMSTNNSSHSP